MRLFINGQEADLQSGSLVLFNYAAGELSQPKIVRNSYSQQVTLPATPQNNLIFGHFAHNDRLTPSGGFNAILRTPFIIYGEMMQILQQGYLRLDTVESKGDTAYSYKVTLYGGLGDLFYRLMYDDEGNKLTLGDITWVTSGESGFNPATTDMRGTDAIEDAWTDLQDGADGIYDAFNFAPCYNGLPSDFDSDKAIYYPTGSVWDIYPNIITSKTEEGITYGTGAEGYIILDLGKSYTEWEMQEIRWYLQRPVVRLKWMLASIVNAAQAAGYTLTLDSSFFNSSNPYYEHTWLTLPLLASGKRGSATVKDWMQGSASPAEYLIGIVRLFGLQIDYDCKTKAATIESRGAFYDSPAPIDLNQRVSLGDGVRITPTLTDTRNMIYSVDESGEYAETYEGIYNRPYGSQRIDTGFEFEAKQIEAFDKIVFKGVPEVLEASSAFTYYASNSRDPLTSKFKNYYLKQSFLGEVSYDLYNGIGTSEKRLSCNAEAGQGATRLLYNPTFYGLDFMSKPQMHGADNNGEEGSNVLLFFNGFKDVPSYTQSGVKVASAPFRITAGMDTVFNALNNGKPCWDLTLYAGKVGYRESLPHFARFLTDEDGVVTYSLEVGDPQSIAVPDITFAGGKGIYARYWQLYNADRYNKDCRVMSCKVDFRGITVNEHLFKRFFAYDNALWVLNKISNHSIEGDALTECEFVRVINRTAYTA